MEFRDAWIAFFFIHEMWIFLRISLVAGSFEFSIKFLLVLVDGVYILLLVE